MHNVFFDHARRRLLVFRGGNGRDYFSTMHGLSLGEGSGVSLHARPQLPNSRGRLRTDTLVWSELATSGYRPSVRANAAGCVFKDRVYIFGGWNGRERFSDLHAFDMSAMCASRRGPVPRT